MEYTQQQIIMENIDKLLRKRNMKRSSLEGEIGVSKGYLSRLKKANPDNNGLKLSFELFKKVAETLKVSMDYLMIDASGNTTDETALIDFFESLYSMSVENTLFWNVFTFEQIDNINDPDDFYKLGPISKVVYESGEYDPEGRSYVYPWVGWLSIGHGRKIGDTIYTKATLIDDLFYSNIEKIGSTLYLYRIDYTDADGHHKLSDIIEAYLVTGDEKHFLCNSTDWGKFISSKLKDLYQIARDKCSSTRLDENARKLLNQFNAN